jgi:hypothetical protein
MNPSGVDEIKRHFNVVAEGLRTEIKLVVEGVVGTNQRLDGMENAVRALDKKLGSRATALDAKLEEKTSSLDGKIDRGFSETQALIKQNYSELDQRIGRTEARLEKLEE